MALYMKQDFSPHILSRKWIAMKFRPNMLINNHQHIVNVLESGLLFREDSVEVEQEAPPPEALWAAAGGGKGALTRGEAAAAVAGVVTALLLAPPTNLHRSSLLKLALYLSLPVCVRAANRARCRGTLAELLMRMRDYLALARRAAACLKEYAALHAQLGSLTSIIESTRALLCRQQSEMSLQMSRASSALLGNAPWLRADVAWEAAEERSDNLMKIHHAFLVVQSTLLKHIAMVHFIPPKQAQRLYKNHNERIYWLHNVLISHLNEEFKENFESLDRMYRLLKNSGSRQDEVAKKLGTAVNDSWLYSDIHTGVARACLELKIALNLSNSLDIFLDSCASNKQEVDLAVLNKDIDGLIDYITKCLTTVQSSQIRLQKLQSKFKIKEKIDDEKNCDVVESAVILKIEDKEPETKDEVFYFIKTEDDVEIVQPAGDLTTAPGKKERETTKVVLCELKRKLGKREDVMRERERQALAKTMPELGNNVPEFERQIKFDEFLERKGYILKIRKSVNHKRLFRHYKIESKSNDHKLKKYKLKTCKYDNENAINGVLYEVSSFSNVKSKLISISCCKKERVLTKWCKSLPFAKKELYSDLSIGSSDAEASAINRTVNQAVNPKDITIKFSKKDLELSNSSSDSDFEHFHREAFLKDARRLRASRKKNHPNHKSRQTIDNGDESSKPIEYSFGAGLAMASVLQINSNARIPNMCGEEVFIGDGQVSNDSGNDENA